MQSSTRFSSRCCSGSTSARPSPIRKAMMAERKRRVEKLKELHETVKRLTIEEVEYLKEWVNEKQSAAAVVTEEEDKARDV